MRINSANLATTSMRPRTQVPAGTSSSTQKNVEKLREISSSKQLSTNDAPDQAANKQKLNVNRQSQGVAKRIASSTYSLVNAHLNKIETPLRGSRGEVSAGGEQSDSNSNNSGYVGRVNARLNQSAINTYRSHQFLDKRDEIMSSFGVNEFA